MVRTHIEYGHSVWCPHSVTAIESLEKVQKRATKLFHGFEKFSYSDRLRKPTLKYSRIRGDMIETYKIITGIYDKDIYDICTKIKLIHNNTRKSIQITTHIGQDMI